MTKILLVGDGNSPFMKDYAFWLKKTANYEIDVFSYTHMGMETEYPYDKILDNNYKKYSSIYKIKKIGFLFIPFLTNFALLKALKQNNAKYDIIHFQWITPQAVLNSDRYKKYTKYIVATFWGDEPNNFKLLTSSNLYNRLLFKFIKNSDCVLGANASKFFCETLFKQLQPNFQWALLGSTPMDHLHNELTTKSREDAKNEFGISTDKITIAICYSGKSLHQQVRIINQIKSSPYYNVFKDKIQLLVPMTYGCGIDYCKKIESMLIDLGIDYKIYYDTYWSNEKVATFRLTADIMLQLAQSDAASNSIREFLCAGSVMMAGGWLRYDVFKDEGFKFIQIDNFDDFDKELYTVIENFSQYHSEYVNLDIEKIKKYTWKANIQNWIDAHNNLLERDI